MDEAIAELVAAAGLTSVSSATVMTPRFAESRHVVFLMLDRRGNVQAVVKVARRRDDHGLRAEAAVLDRLRALWPEGTDTYPTVLSSTTWREHDILAESAVGGRLLTPRQLRRAPAPYVAAYLTWVESLPRAGGCGSDGWFRPVQDALDTLEHQLEPDAPERRICARLGPFLEPLRQVPLRPAFEHGDLSAPNLMWRRSEPRVGVVDWEMGRETGMPGYDAAVFLAFVAFSSAGARGTGAETEVFRREFLAEDGRGRSMLRRHLRRIEVPDDAVDHVLVAAWTRRAVSVFSRLSGGRLLNEFRAGRSHALWRALTDAVGLG